MYKFPDMRNKDPVQSYIIRIYRKRKGRKPVLVGTAEKVGLLGKKAFTNFDELREILSGNNPVKDRDDEKCKEAGSTNK
jgi:hypothetical protein